MVARTLTAGEVAKALGVKPVTLRKWASQGRVPCDRTVGGHRRFSLEEVRAATGHGGRLVEELAPFLRGEVARWQIQPRHISIFGSIARGQEREGSDIDLFVVDPQFRSEKQRRIFGQQMVALHFAVDMHFDRDLREVELDLAQLEKIAREPADFLVELLDEGVLIAGTSLGELLLPIVERLESSGAA